MAQPQDSRIQIPEKIRFDIFLLRTALMVRVPHKHRYIRSRAISIKLKVANGNVFDYTWCKTIKHEPLDLEEEEEEEEGIKPITACIALQKYLQC